MIVRIAVAVAKDGSWNAGGYGDANGPKEAKWVVDGLPEHVSERDYHIVHIEADVPLPPEPLVIQGTVVE